MTEEVQNDAAPSSTGPVGNDVGGASPVETSASEASAPVAEALPAAADLGNDASPAAGSSTAEPASAPAASADAGVSQTDESSHAEPATFEERVEQRFLALEGYLMKLPHSLAHAFSQGSAEPEELASRVLAHLFNK